MIPKKKLIGMVERISKSTIHTDFRLAFFKSDWHSLDQIGEGEGGAQSQSR